MHVDVGYIPGPTVVSAKTDGKIYDLHVELEGITPCVWRRVVVPADLLLCHLHELLQLVMGWTGSHLHSFEIGDRLFSAPHLALEDMDMLNEEEYTLEAALGDSIHQFIYEYDFTDNWYHRIRVGPRANPRSDWFYPLCVGGARAAPPDDVGGVVGYDEFLRAIRDPGHQEHANVLAWMGGPFDPEGFDLNAINRLLRFGAGGRPNWRCHKVV